MYTDAMQQVYSNVTKVLVESRQGSNLLYLPLDKIMQMTGAVPGSDGVAPPSPAAGAAVPAGQAPLNGIPLDSRARDSSRTRDRETR
jgi:membrane protease subunit HflK